jgi:hypothetical protein
MSEEHPMIDEFLDAYISAALWSTNDNADDSGGEPLDRNYSEDDIAPETLAKMRADCNDFLNDVGGELISMVERLIELGSWDKPGGPECTLVAYAGHDFWLTREGHGCGFWETDDWPEPIGKILTDKSQEFGNFDLYVGDDGLIYGD